MLRITTYHGITYLDILQNYLIFYKNISDIINELWNSAALIGLAFEQFLSLFENGKLNNIPFFFYFGILFCLSTIFSFLFVSHLGLYGVFKLNIVTLSFFWFSLLINFNEYILNNEIILINMGRWFYIFHNYPVNLEFYMDTLSLAYMLLTLTISYFVQWYTFAYFRYEPIVERLVLFLNLFILSMVFFVSSANLILLFLGWELIGLTSFVLINFWVTRKATLKAAFKAFVFNKISDVFFFIFILLALFIFDSIEIILINKQIYSVSLFTVSILNIDFSIVELLSFFLMGAAFIKSAQIGFHLWLPDSMEAPVPASALIHSATLVSAGLFLLLRFSPIFELSNYIIFVIGFMGALTGLYGGLTAMFQSDIKRILAYSTISHCGFLMVSFFFFSTEITLLYLYVHGFFKAGVFLCVGNIIRFNNNYQDFRKMGGLHKYLPSDCLFIVIGLFNLGGLPFSIGFYMKHCLLVAIQQNTIFNSVLITICIFGALTGIFYAYKLLDYVFFDFKKAKKNIYIRFRKKYILNKSLFFMNSICADIAIFFLFVMAYIICFSYYSDIENIKPSYDLILSKNNNFFDLFFKNWNFLWNIATINWLIFFLLSAIFYSFWRNTAVSIQLYNSFFTNLAFFMFLTIFLMI